MYHQLVMSAKRQPGRLNLGHYLVFFLTAILLGGLVFWASAYLKENGAPTSPNILYLSWDDNERLQLFQTDITGTLSKQLTTHLLADITHFAVSPDGTHIAYTIQADDSQTAIWLIDRQGRNARVLVTCGPAICGEVVWAPDNRRLIYERREPASPDTLPGAPRLWWLDVVTGETVTVLQNKESRGTGARLSPDGQWISYASPENEGIEVYNFQDGRHFYIPSQLGIPAIWNPESTTLLVTDLDLIVSHSNEESDHLEHTHGYDEVVYLFKVDIDDTKRVAISPEGIVDDGVPAWSPDGQWIAFGRKRPRTAMGRQLWLMHPDGSEARALTDDPTVQHGPPAWSPDGRYLLFQRYDLTTPTDRPGIWLIDVTSSDTFAVAEVGIQPAWLP